MKNLLKTASRTMVIAGVLLSPLMAGEAMAQTACPTDCSSGPPYTVGCMYNKDPATYYCTGTPQDGEYAGPANGPCTNGTGTWYYCTYVTPEMSDYLAMAFIVMAGGMIYYFRRRALASA